MTTSGAFKLELRQHYMTLYVNRQVQQYQSLIRHYHDRLTVQHLSLTQSERRSYAYVMGAKLSHEVIASIGF